MIILNCYKTYDAFLNQHGENYQQEVFKNIKIFMDIEDLKEQREYLLNLSKEKGMKICEFSLLNLNFKKYILEFRMIVKKNNVFFEDYEELPFVRMACGDFTVGEEEN